VRRWWRPGKEVFNEARFHVMKVVAWSENGNGRGGAGAYKVVVGDGNTQGGVRGSGWQQK
jgi:hypothetical protein